MSQIRFFKTSNHYPSYLNGFYAKHPEIGEMSFEKGLETLHSDCFAWADFWKKNLELTGRYTCMDVVQNAEPIQKKWAREHGVSYSGENWMAEILLAQIEAFKPDVLFVVEQYNDASFLKNIRQRVPSIRLILGWDGIAYCDAEAFQYSDIVLTNMKESGDYYVSHGKQTYYHKPCFETTLPDRIPGLTRKYDLSFTGSLVANEHYHLDRLHKLAQLNRSVPMAIFASELPPNRDLFTLHGVKNALKARNPRLSIDLHQITRANKGPVYGLDMFRVLGESRIVFNTHAHHKISPAANMRLMEVTGMGACLLTDWKPNLSDLFDPEREVVSFKTISEAVSKVKELLANPGELDKIAKAGQQRTYSQYSYKIAMEKFAAFLESVL